LIILFFIPLDHFIKDFTTLSTYNKKWVFLIDGCIKICIYSMMFESGMTTVIRSQKVRVRENGYRTHYDCGYDALLYLKKPTYPFN
jgi:hypothetical protein